METVPFLRDVDDEKHYAQLLEVAYCEAATELNVLLHEMNWMDTDAEIVTIETTEVLAWLKRITRLQSVMIGTVGDSTERRRRLANIT